MDEGMLCLMNIDADYVTAYTQIKSIIANDAFGKLQKMHQAEVRQKLKNVDDGLRALKQLFIFRNVNKLIDCMITCARDLNTVVGSLQVQFESPKVMEKRVMMISLYYEEFIRMGSDLKQICEMRVMHASSTANMREVIALLNTIILKLEITSEDSPPTGPGRRV